MSLTSRAGSPASAYVKNTAPALCYLCSLCTYVFRGKRHKGEQPLKEQNKVRLLPMVIAFQSMKYVFGVTKSPFGVPIHYVHVVVKASPHHRVLLALGSLGHIDSHKVEEFLRLHNAVAVIVGSAF